MEGSSKIDVDVVPRGIKDERESSTMTLTFSRRHTLSSWKSNFSQMCAN